MTVGLSAANLANKWLDMLGATAFTAPTTVYVKLHTGDPGSAATANASGTTTRVALTWSSASAGSKAISNTPSWSSWAAGTETISHVSLWDASTSGNFLWSGALSASKTVNDGDTFTLSSLTCAISSIAA